MQFGEGEDDWRVLLLLMAVASLAGFVWALPKLVRSLILFLRHLPVDGSLRQIGRALLDALCAADLIQSRRDLLEVRIQELERGHYSLALAVGSFYEKALFADSLAELLWPIHNPRYL